MHISLDHKKRYRETMFGKLWTEAATTEWFQQGLQTALLEFRTQLPQPIDIGTASANEMKTQGAEKMVRILLNLTEQNTDPKPRLNQNLDFNS